MRRFDYRTAGHGRKPGSLGPCARIQTVTSERPSRRASSRIPGPCA